MSPSWLRHTSLVAATLLTSWGVVAPTAHAAPSTTVPPVEQRGTNLDDFSGDPVYAQWYHQQLSWSAANCPKAAQTVRRLHQQQPGMPQIKVIECATVVAPKDWHDASKGSIDVGISRLIYGDTPERPARLMLSNPGGPGVGSLFGEPASVAISRKTTSTHLNVGIDVRGLGTSTTLECAAPSEARPKDVAGDLRNASAQFVKDDLTWMNRRVHGCAQQADSLLPYITTEQTARDFNLVRHVLGYQTADMEAGSYGSWLGSVVGKMFPRSFDRLVLDANMDHVTGNFLTTFSSQPESRQAALDRTVLPWLARHHDTARLGSTPAEVNANIEALRDALAKRELSPLWNPDLLDILLITSLDSVFAMPGNTQLVVEMFAKWKYGTPMLPESVAQLDEMSSDDETLPPGIVFNEMVQYAVTCNDTGSFGSVDDAVNTVLDARRRYPLSGAYHGVVLCADWPTPGSLTPELLNRPLYALMTQTENDPRTIYRGAHHSRFASAGHVRMVVVDDLLSHGVQNNRCAGLVATDYLAKGIYPAADVRCQAGPLPGDDNVYEFMNPGSASNPLPAPFTYTTRDLSDAVVDVDASAKPRRHPSASERATEELVRQLRFTGRPRV